MTKEINWLIQRDLTVLAADLQVYFDGDGAKTHAVITKIYNVLKADVNLANFTGLTAITGQTVGVEARQ